MGGHSKTRVEINSEVADNEHHTVKNFVQICRFPAIWVGGIKQSCVSDVCLSVAYIVPNLRTQRPKAM